MEKKIRLIAVSVLAALVMAGCGSAPKAGAALSAAEIRAEQGVNNVETRTTRSTVVDWANRNVGEESVPLWLKPLIKGNAGPVKSEYGIASTSRVKYSIAQRANREEARVQAGLLFAAQTASELKEYVVTAAGQTLNEGQIDIVEEITTATKVNITGTERVADFWQLVETEDPSTRIKNREYIYYVVWAMPQATWTALTRKYVNDVIGQIPDRQVQTNVASAYGAIQAAADRETAMSDAEFLQKLRLQERTAQNEADIDWITALSAASTVMFD
ncbi:MAG: hypothetical protein LBK61_02525 [Spirochaetaceae bacterium]|nr:hypothetical protein [Spirochaetaceae bacterium]